MEEGGLRKFIPIVIVLIVLGLIIVAGVSFVRGLFAGDDSGEEVVSMSRQALVNTDESRGVRMTVRGPIDADEEHFSYTVTITPAQRTMTTYQGYLLRQLGSKQNENNLPAYEQLVYALDRAGMMHGTELPGNSNDTRGICATGRLYEFAILRNNSPVKMLWSSTCEGSPGSLAASEDQLAKLFKDQIPEYKALVKPTKLQ